MSHRAGTLMTLLVIGIAMLLPLGLHLTLVNLERVDLQEEQWGAMSVFMAPAANASAVEGLMQELRGLDTVERVAALSPAESMQEFLQQSGFSESMLPLDDNPLPWVITVVPVGGAGLEARVLALSDILQGRPLVEAVELDREWLQRLGRFIELGEAVVATLALLFALAVVVVVANTIRLDVAARSQEIEVMSLVGARPGFIRQPFLYSGFWYGLLGGVVAMILVNLGLEYLDRPLARLLETYGQEGRLQGLGLRATLALLLAGGLLGLLGAWFAVQQYLRMMAQSGTLGRR
ncbi:MAG: cell division protein [Xanthomonadales bacterium]|nr:cell division protein [Xanthomonadales bacterium]